MEFDEFLPEGVEWKEISDEEGDYVYDLEYRKVDLDAGIIDAWQKKANGKDYRRESYHRNSGLCRSLNVRQSIDAPNERVVWYMFSHSLSDPLPITILAPLIISEESGTMSFVISLHKPGFGECIQIPYYAGNNTLGEIMLATSIPAAVTNTPDQEKDQADLPNLELALNADSFTPESYQYALVQRALVKHHPYREIIAVVDSGTQLWNQRLPIGERLITGELQDENVLVNIQSRVKESTLENPTLEDLMRIASAQSKLEGIQLTIPKIFDVHKFGEDLRNPDPRVWIPAAQSFGFSVAMLD